MAQSWRSGRRGDSARVVVPLDQAALDRSALRYVERYATTRAKLAAYLKRKIRERGWGAEEPPAIDALVERFARLGYVNDAAFADARAASLTRRGYGLRRVADSLRAAGVEDKDASLAADSVRDDAWAAAMVFARRRKIGPFAPTPPDRPARDKALGAMLRAGHDMDTARRILSMDPESVSELD